ncbi:hypothetical protein EDD18DRAFT_1106656 [Armillaria luteobubalina]|uniref:Uncharacterized protein n=1 Tax=Armillaria luteobubalina TaxID=153913 RepID=A0AA39Q276_9AGAR|nr:hypothetical protein EDD18DRAFT_1106656 [Armillaria luteobubalina]
MEDDEQDQLAVGMSMEGQDVLVPGPRKQAVMLSGALMIWGLPHGNLTTAVGRRISTWAANPKDFRGFESRRRRLSSGSGPESEADHLLIIEEESLRAYESWSVSSELHHFSLGLIGQALTGIYLYQSQ